MKSYTTITSLHVTSALNNTDLSPKISSLRGSKAHRGRLAYWMYNDSILYSIAAVLLHIKTLNIMNL